MLRKARTKHPKHRFVHGDIRVPGTIPLDSDFIVSLFGSFSYIMQPAPVALEIQKALTKTGELFVMVYGHASQEKGTYSLSTLSTKPTRKYYSKEAIQKIFPEFEVRGFDRLVCRMPAWMPAVVRTTLLTAEFKWLRGAFPTPATYFIARGTHSPSGPARSRLG